MKHEYDTVPLQPTDLHRDDSRYYWRFLLTFHMFHFAEKRLSDARHNRELAEYLPRTTHLELSQLRQALRVMEEEARL